MTSKLILLLLWRKIKGFRCSLPVNVCKILYASLSSSSFHNLFSQGHRFTHITCTGSICNHSLKCGCHFSTLDINAHFRILFIAKFEFLKLHLKVRSFERMFEFNQVRLGPSVFVSVSVSVSVCGHARTQSCSCMLHKHSQTLFSPHSQFYNAHIQVCSTHSLCTITLFVVMCC